MRAGRTSRCRSQCARTPRRTAPALSPTCTATPMSERSEQARQRVAGPGSVSAAAVALHLRRRPAPTCLGCAGSRGAVHAIAPASPRSPTLPLLPDTCAPATLAHRRPTPAISSTRVASSPCFARARLLRARLRRRACASATSPSTTPMAAGLDVTCAESRVCAREVGVAWEHSALRKLRAKCNARAGRPNACRLRTRDQRGRGARG